MSEVWKSAKEWANEAVRCQVPSDILPKDRRNVSIVATRESWPSRKREASGGGVEYPLSALPKEFQRAYALRQLTETGIGVDDIAQAVDRVAQVQIPDVETGNEKRRDAILMVLSLWDIFRSRFAGPGETARHHFCTLYTKGGIEGIPDWVAEALTSKNGSRKGLSVRTLHNYEAARREGRLGDLGGRYRGRVGILDRAEGGKVASMIAALIVKNPHFSADHLRDMVIDKFGTKLDLGDGKKADLPGLRAFQRFVTGWKASHQDVFLKMTDPDGWKNKRRFSGSNMNSWVKRPNQLWEIDASPADALLLDGRYAIYACVDIHTRRMMVHVTRTAKTDATLLLIRRAIIAWGVPEIIRTDNGSDFTSYHFRRALTALGIQHDISDPFSPEQKGTVERHIGTLQRGFMPLLPGYIGHSVADRKQIEARKSFAQRLGTSDEKAFCVELTHEDMQAAVDQWVEAKYHHKPHDGLKGKTPAQMIAAYLGPIRRIENARALDLMLAPVAGKDGIRTVTKSGILVDKATFISPALVVGDVVLCRHDPDDMGRLYVYSEDGKDFICVAVCPERVGVNPGEAVRAVRAAQAERLKNEVEPLQKEIRRMKPRDQIDAVLRAAADAAGNVVSLPKPTEAHTTPALEAAAQAAQVRPGRVLTPTPLTAEDEARLEALAAQFTAPVPAKRSPVKSAEVVVMDPGQRLARVMEIEQRIACGDDVSEEERRWAERQSKLPDVANRRRMYEIVGDAALTA